MTTPDVLTEVQPRLVIDRVDDAILFYHEVLGAELIERFVDGR